MTLRCWHRIRPHDRHASRGAAFTIVESVAAILIVSIAVTAALNTLGAVKLSQANTAERRRGHLVAHALMSEILALRYADPDVLQSSITIGTVFTLGPEPGEVMGNRTAFDDVDDYNGWSSASLKRKDGTTIAQHNGWSRSVVVEWVDRTNLDQRMAVESGVKRITVTASKNGAEVAQVTALRTIGLPSPDNAPKLLLVVNDPAALTDQERARKGWIESWGYEVVTIGASEPQSKYDTAVTDADVAYIPQDISAAVLGTKLQNAAIGVVNEDPEWTAQLGICASLVGTTATDLWVVDNSHYIMSGFPVDWVTVFTATQPFNVLNGWISSDQIALGGNRLLGPLVYASMAVLETGGEVYSGGTAPARRVQLPWGGAAFDITTITADGKTIMRRSIDWAAERER